MTSVINISERTARISEIPAAFIAVSSLLSPRFPNVISAESRIAKGRACGTRIRLMYQKNCARTSIESPFPISSSIYLHRNCIISTNWQMKNVPTKSSPNCFAIKISNFFILNITYRCCRSCFPTMLQKYYKKSEVRNICLLFHKF